MSGDMERLEAIEKRVTDTTPGSLICIARRELEWLIERVREAQKENDEKAAEIASLYESLDTRRRSLESEAEIRSAAYLRIAKLETENAELIDTVLVGLREPMTLDDARRLRSAFTVVANNAARKAHSDKAAAALSLSPQKERPNGA